MKPKIVPLLERCVDDGIKLGYNRAVKHTETPDPGYVQQCIYEAVIREIYEWFDFDELN